MLSFQKIRLFCGLTYLRVDRLWSNLVLVDRLVWCVLKGLELVIRLVVDFLDSGMVTGIGILTHILIII